MTIRNCGRLAVVVSFVAALVMPAAAIAQEEEPTGPNFLLVRTVHLKTAGSAEWIELQAQLAEAQREAGADPRDVWEVVRGPMDTFHIVSFHNDRAGFDEPPGGDGPPLGDAQADWLAAIGGTIASRTETESSIHADLAIPLDEGAEPNLLVLRRFSLKSGQTGAFHDWLRDELKPALESGGAKGVYFSHLAQGGDVDTCVIAGHAVNWAEFDGDGAFGHMSEEERDALFANWGDMVADHTMDVLSYRADLSY